MGKINYLIEGVSGTGKTSVCHELRRRGYVAFNGDRELRYQGDPTTGEKTEGVGHGLPPFVSPEMCHAQNSWDVEKVTRLAAHQDDDATFFCGGSRNFKQFIDLFDEIFILDVDAETLNERLDNRPNDDWGKCKSERELILRLHATKEDIPSSGIVIDATQPLVSVVDEILSHVRDSVLLVKPVVPRLPHHGGSIFTHELGASPPRACLWLTLSAPRPSSSARKRCVPALPLRPRQRRVIGSARFQHAKGKLDQLAHDGADDVHLTFAARS